MESIEIVIFIGLSKLENHNMFITLFSSYQPFQFDNISTLFQPKFANAVLCCLNKATTIPYRL